MADIRASKCGEHKQFIVDNLPSSLARSILSDDEITVAMNTSYGSLETNMTFYFELNAPRMGSYALPSECFLIRPLGQADVTLSSSFSNLANVRRLIDPKWIDMRTLRQWKTQCDENHGSACTTDVSSKVTVLSPIRPMLLIDVEQHKLVEPGPDVKYVALSYVWGGQGQFDSRLSNISTLKSQGALSTAPLARTAQVAIDIVRQLGERYLWIDSLCIIQDDPVSKQQQLENMCGIYLNATLTIIAADGRDAQDSLSGVPDHGQTRTFNAKTWSVGGFEIAQAAPHDTYRSKWATRGWTWQEDMFSLRSLIFTPESVYWKCSLAQWREDCADMADLPNNGTELKSRVRTAAETKVPSIWNFVPDAYSTRYFTFPEDTLDAFAGMAKALSLSFPGGFVSGLPVFFFDITLLWVPKRDMERKVAKRQGNNVCLPSWSWAGWSGTIEERWWYGTQGHIRTTELLDPGSKQWMGFVPLVEWYVQSEPNGDKTRLTGTFDNYEKFRNCSEEDLAAFEAKGWRRHCNLDAGALPSGPIVLRALYPQLDYFWTHETLGSAELWYPIPLATDGVSSGLPALRKVKFISSRTQRAFVKASKPHAQSYDQLIMTIRDNDTDAWLGYLYLNEKPSQERGSVEGSLLELVEIARGEVLESMAIPLDEMRDSERPSEGKHYEFYFVLWIVRKGDFAERRGVGRVVCERWENLQREEIELVLG